MIYLFVQSVVPTVPAGWLTFADGVVYKHYDEPVRVWGISVTDDQQLAGAIMKIGGSMFLWAIIVFMFFKRFGTELEGRGHLPPDGRAIERHRHQVRAESPAPVDDGWVPPARTWPGSTPRRPVRRADSRDSGDPR